MIKPGATKLHITIHDTRDWLFRRRWWVRVKSAGNITLHSEYYNSYVSAQKMVNTLIDRIREGHFTVDNISQETITNDATDYTF